MLCPKVSKGLKREVFSNGNNTFTFVSLSITSKLALTMHVANLVSYESADGKSTMTIGFEGVSNPFAMAGFGLLYRF